jgi:hypothetical protein
VAQVSYLEDEKMKIARGMVKNVIPIHISGYNPNSSADETVWTAGGPYPWSSLATAQTLYLKSSTNNATDRAMLVTIEGLDSNFDILKETIHLNETNSTTAVATSNTFLRINDMYCSDANTNVGDITAHITSGSGTVVDQISAGHGRNMTGIYTIPAGYTGYLVKGNFSSSTASVVTFFIRPYNGGFILSHIATADNTAYEYEFPFPGVMPEKTDLDVRLEAGTGKSTCNFDILLVKNP